MSAAATNAAIRTGGGAAIAGIAMAGIEHHGSTYSLAAAVCAAVVGGATNAATTVRDWFAARQLAVYFFGQLPH